jgi:hypothetical protein
MKLTWKALIVIEPKLQELYLQAKSYRKNKGDFCANEVWYGGAPSMKGKLCELVGWDAPYTPLRSPEAYDLAYDTIYDALPECTHEGACR